MSVYQADALVIRSREYGESDRLLTLFSREQGKLHAVAKGVRKPKSKQRAGAQLFTYADFLIYRGRTLDTVNQASPKESFSHIWGDLDKSLAASAIAELLDIGTVQGQPYPELFTLTLSSFFLLEHIDPALLQSAYALRLLTYLGYRPELLDCAVCGKTIHGIRIYFSPEEGGVVCSDCLGDNARLGRWLQAGSVAFMRQLLTSDVTKLDRLRWNDGMKKEIVTSLQFLCEQTFNKRLKSWSMGNRLANVGQNLSGKGGKVDERNIVDRTGES
ncbi:DNA repair protein RecO [Desulfitobacterium metallireducens]|uniref:DNA repair protein RecO n=1 Tax=Desulfitobacterium metallireducens DSM 15288 TaxID=871968 RepID=W0EF71_9FIRM|nr:DNA repair protein RecO [Desulfitobacterium metallireducens]AHF07844.1 DNA repair protein RecO [Desulfitobacterium metallireducens DSM 15288]